MRVPSAVVAEGVGVEDDGGAFHAAQSQCCGEACWAGADDNGVEEGGGREG